MNQPAPLRWGVLSTANIGRRAVLPAIQRSASSALAAVASRDLATAQAFATELAIPQLYGSAANLRVITALLRSAREHGRPQAITTE
jgi:predicted dehydrogenase